MKTNQERIYVACQMIDGVANSLLDLTSCGVEISYFDLIDLIGRLDLAVFAIRQTNENSG